MSKLAGAFAKQNVSIKEVKQVSGGDGRAQVIIITHTCHESLVKKALAKLEALEEVFELKGMIRMED